MKINKRTGLLICLLVMISVFFCLCGCNGNHSADSKDDGKISVVTTVFPAYDWVCQVVGNEAERYDISMIADNGADLHSYQPTAADILKISQCDMLVYVGGESDRWVAEAAGQAQNKDMTVINLLEAGAGHVLAEETVEGMKDDGHDHDGTGGHSHDEEQAADEHIWLSLRAADTMVGSIEEGLAGIDPAHADEYMRNGEVYREKLRDLDAKYSRRLADAPKDTLIFADRFPFLYMLNDYNIDYYAAFAGCSAETEADFETLAFLIDQADRIGAGTILTMEGSDDKIARTVAAGMERDDIQIKRLNSMQYITAGDMADGASYLSIMEENLQVLCEALGA